EEGGMHLEPGSTVLVIRRCLGRNGLDEGRNIVCYPVGVPQGIPPGAVEWDYQGLPSIKQELARAQTPHLARQARTDSGKEGGGVSIRRWPPADQTARPSGPRPAGDTTGSCPTRRNRGPR